MTYNATPKICIYQNTTHTSHQKINSTTYTEVSGSKCNLNNSEQRSMNLYYKFNFSCGYDPSASSSQSSSGHQYLFNMKLQSSNDNFSSDITDIPNCKFNISHDIIGAGSNTGSDLSIMTYTPFMILENFNKSYLRLMARVAQTSHYKGMLHGYTTFDGSSYNWYYPSLLQVVEI